MNSLKLLNQGSFQLKSKGIFSHILDAEILLSKILGKKREKILVNLDQIICNNQIKLYKKLIARRSLKEPIAYILNEKEFWGKSFEVNKNTLIPRPETELMVEKLLTYFKQKKVKILDIGTGTGCILVSLLSELKKSSGVGIDISKKALLIANKNAKRYLNETRYKFINKSFKDVYNYKFDLIVSNPPYIKSIDMKNLDQDIKRFEPHIALDGGNDGLDVIRKVIYKAREILKINGTLALEIGSGQFRKVSEILKSNNFKIENRIKDFEDNIRCIISSLKR